MTTRHQKIEQSKFSCLVTNDGFSVAVKITRAEGGPGWRLKVVNPSGTSITWQEVFPTDEAAFEAFGRTVQLEGLDYFRDDATVSSRSRTPRAP